MSSYNLSSSRVDDGPGNSTRIITQAAITTEERVRLPNKLLIVLAESACAVAGGTLAWLLVPWLQAHAYLWERQFGASPEVFRDVSRASGIAAYGLLWLSMVFGVLISGRISRVWPGGPEAFELHRYSSLLALGFSFFHAAVLVGDPRLGGNPVPLFAFGALSAKAPWAWLGQFAIYALAIVVGSFFVRRWIGRKTWRLIHVLTLVLYLAALIHSVGATADSSFPLLAVFYLVTTSGLAVLALFRLVAAIKGKRRGKIKHEKMSLQQPG